MLDILAQRVIISNVKDALHKGENITYEKQD